MNRKTEHENIGTVLVVGAGISGIRSALDLAECGYRVILTEREPHIGGILSQLDYQFPTNRCGMCRMLPMVNRDNASQYCLRKGLFHENIEIALSSELISLEGEAGNFQAAFRRKPELIKADRCIGCAECARVCPVEVPDLFNSGFSMRKAVYLPVPHQIPNIFVIDRASCTRCGACEEVCPTGAISFADQGRKKFHILVVDDELIVRDSLKEWLDDEGFSAEMAESGKEALEKLAEQSYHLMLLDIKMAEMDGVTVLKKAKERFPALPVLMMTAYATVETAIGAMKIGAVDYLLKPFDTEAVIPKIVEIYQRFEASLAWNVRADAVILSCGTSLYDPAQGKNSYGYKIFPGVVTSLEFERVISGTGPCSGQLLSPHDRRAVKKIAWFQCTGSRDLQSNADFCSSVCCMYAIKEALMAKSLTHGEAETTIFYMDMRTVGKSFQRYKESAEKEHGVRFEHARVHSVIPSQNSSELTVRYIDSDGAIHEESFDMVVLPVGQRPAKETKEISEITGISLNPFGFPETIPFFSANTSRHGIMAGGSFSGFRDISDSLIQASAAAACASTVIRAAGRSAMAATPPEPASTELLREPPRVMVALCTCQKKISPYIISDNMDSGDLQESCNMKLAREFMADPDLSGVISVDRLCTAEGWRELIGEIRSHQPNRLLVGACMPYLYRDKLSRSESETGLSGSLVRVADILSPILQNPHVDGCNHQEISSRIYRTLAMELAGVRRLNPATAQSMPVSQKVLVAGGGVAGMSAALAVADSGFQTYLIEKSETLGGNIQRFKETIEGYQVQNLLAQTLERVEKHPLIELHKMTEIVASFGDMGHFLTTVENLEKSVQTIEHGAVIIATGGKEAEINSYGYGSDRAIMTQLEFEKSVSDATFNIGSLSSVVMIQCAGTREEPRNYCSRVCCSTSLRQALFLKRENPEITITILYRDIMSYGFSEAYYTQARQAGILFIRYTPDRKPVVHVGESKVAESGATDKRVCVRCFEPIIGQDVEIEADIVLLAAGVVPNLPLHLASAFGFTTDEDGFFQEAESKWRPVDSLKDGVFACGLAHSPRNIPEAIATAQAAAQHAIRVVSNSALSASRVTAEVRHTICSLCGLCIETCPYGARAFDLEHEKVLVNSLMCQGCGACATICPNKASFVEGFSSQQMFEMIEASVR